MPIVVKRPPLLPIIIENEVRLGSDPSASDLWLEIQAEHLRPPECIASLASSICCATDQCHRIVAVLLKQPDHVLAHNLIRLRGDIHYPHFRPAGDGIHHLRERNRRTPPMLNRHPGRRASIEKTLRRTIAQIAGVFPIEGRDAISPPAPSRDYAAPPVSTRSRGESAQWRPALGPPSRSDRRGVWRPPS